MNEKTWKNIKTVNEWLDKDYLPKGYTVANAKFKRDYNRIAKSLKIQSAYLYFIGVVMEVYSLTKMMYSAKRQAGFCEMVAHTLDEKRVEPEHAKVFQEDVDILEKRLETITRITKENIHLSEYEPFFEAEIYGHEFDFDFDKLKERAKNWNESHKDEVEKHMMEIHPELKKYGQFKEKRAKAIKAEKEAEKQKKREEKIYVEEILKNEQRHKARQKRIDKSFE